MRISEECLRKLIREELINSGNLLNEELLIEGFMQDLSGQVGRAAAIGLMMMSLSGTASAKGLISHMNDTLTQAQNEEKNDELEVKGVGKLKEVQDELRKKIRANPFGGMNIISDYIEKFEEMGEDGNRIMKEVLKLFESDASLKKQYNLVYRAFKTMSKNKALKKIGM